MKNTIKKGTGLIVVLTCIAFSCKDKFLEVQPTGQLASVDALLLTTTGLDGLLLSAYSQLNARGFTQSASSNNWVRGSISGGEANKGSNSGDFNALTPFQRYELQASSGEINQKWQAMYEGVSRSNVVLRTLAAAGSNVPDADQKRIAGEARFLRAHYYFELKRAFNMVPYVDETTDYVLGVKTDVVSVGNDVDIWPKIEADFKFAYDNLTEVPGAAGRANKWAAASYLAKTYLYQGRKADGSIVTDKFQAAKTLFDLIIAGGKTANGKKYGLVAKYSDLFNAEKDNNEESIFAIQAAANAGSSDNANPDLVLNFPYNTGSNGPAGCCGFFAPSFELANSFRTTADGLPLLDGSYNVGANQLITDQGVKSADPFTLDAGPVDPRLDHSIGRRGIQYLDWQPHPGLDWIRDQGFAGPYSPKKFVFYKSQDKTLTDGSSWTDGYSAINYNIIRYADVLLMAAEVEVEIGTLAKALEYVNLVRNRAADPAGFVQQGGKPAANYVIKPYPAFASKEAARAAVYFERKLELSGEGHRFYDLVRWGIADTVLNAYLAYEAPKLPTGFLGAKFTKGKDEYMPIPQTQVDIQSGLLKQNPGY